MNNESSLKKQFELNADSCDVAVLANNPLTEDSSETADLYTNLRKHKKYKENMDTRKCIKSNQMKENHKPLPSCHPNKCKKRNSKISQLQRSEINKKFWDLSWLERRTYSSGQNYGHFWKK